MGVIDMHVTSGFLSAGFGEALAKEASSAIGLFFNVEGSSFLPDLILDHGANKMVSGYDQAGTCTSRTRKAL